MSADDPYVACSGFSRDQWAWAFLRRNPAYRADYTQFMTIWRALEADYGAPPHRDFARWKHDARAYGPLPNSAKGIASATVSGDACLGENDAVLLECWMGAKWGFHKFPLDPAIVAPDPTMLSWRPPPPAPPRDPGDAYRLDLAFDLSLPLPPQLEAARFRLVSAAAGLRRAGSPAPLTVDSLRTHWVALLRVLDAAEAAGAAGADVADWSADSQAQLRAARAMTEEGYYAILRLADSATRSR